MRPSKRYAIKVGVQVHLRGNNTIYKLVVAPRTKTPSPNKVRSSTSLSAPRWVVMRNTLENWKGAFWDRLKEHFGTPLLPTQSFYRALHQCGQFSIVGREAHGVTRTIKDAMLIRGNDLYLNRSLGKYQLPHIRDNALQDTLTLHLR